MSWHDRASERGAVAVIFAICAVMLFSVAALAVDLGNAFSRKRDVQNQADFSALAAASELPSTGATLCPGSSPAATDPVVIEAMNYLNDNRPQSGDGKSPLVVASQLVDCNIVNGEVSYPTKYKVKVITPQALVKYGLAKVMGFDSANVSADATVGMGSPGGNAAMPFYGVNANGCDWGPQKLSDPANGKAQVVVPNFFKPLETNKSKLSLLTPASVPFQPTTGQPTVVIDGTGVANVTKVGFFRDLTLTPNFYEVTLSQPNLSTSKVTVVVPAEVTSVEDIWYVRVYGPAAGNPDQYSSAVGALPLRIGESLFQCPGLSSSGNFGSLSLPRKDVSSVNDMLAKNIAVGPESPLSLTVYPGGLTAPATCTAGSPSVISDLPSPGLMEGTNCVDTDTGLTANGTTAGLITGGSGFTGRLIKPPSSGCDPNGGSATRSVSIGPKTYPLNNDILTCFFTNDTVTIDTISRATYPGPAVLSPAIYSSPRFAWVPIVNIEPDEGGSNKYSIVDFRPAFITGQTKYANKATPWDGTSKATDKSDNGLTIDNNGVTSMQVVFFNHTALPALAGGAPVGPYLGVGPKIIQLID